LVWAAIARLSGSVRDIWLSPLRSSSVSSAPYRPALLAQRLDLFREVLGARAVCRGFLDIALVEPQLLG
jgi:hypothetical protein